MHLKISIFFLSIALGYILHFRIFYSIVTPDIVVVVADTVLSIERDKASRIILRLMVIVMIIVMAVNFIMNFFLLQFFEDKRLNMNWSWSQTALLFWWYWCFKGFLFMAWSYWTKKNKMSWWQSLNLHLVAFQRDSCQLWRKLVPGTILTRARELQQVK